MKPSFVKTIVLSVFFVLSAAVALSAAEGTSPGRGMMGQSDFAMAPGITRQEDDAMLNDERYVFHGDRSARLSREDARRLDAVRSGFLDQTRELREEIAGKRLSVRSELMRHNPNSARLARLQLELAELESRFGREIAAHRLEARRIVPGIELGSG